MKLPVFLAIAAAFLGFARAEDGLKDQTNPQVTAADVAFLNEAWRRELTSVRMAELATTNGGTQTVQRLGDQLQVAHAKIREQLKALAKQKAVNLWGEPDNLRISELQQLRGEAFDRHYLAEVVKHHEDAIADFDTAFRESSDPDVKAFVSKTLPVLRQLLAGVKKLRTPEAVAPRTAPGI